MKKISSILLLSLSVLLPLSCDNDNNGNSDITAQLGVSIGQTEEVIEVIKRQSKTFDIAVVSNPGPAEALIVTIGANAELVDAYNEANGTSYEMLPASAYEIPSDPFLIPRYNKKSTLSSFSLKGVGCEPNQIYLLPLVVDKVEGDAAYEKPEEKILYILFRMLPPEQEGDGSVDDPYIIDKAEGLAKMGNMLLADETVYIKLAADFNLDGVNWESIDGAGKKIALDGDGHKISNLSAALFSTLEGSVENLVIDSPSVTDVTATAGILANTVADGSSVKNITVTNASLNNETGIAGGLIGTLKGGSVEKVSVAGTIVGSSQVGGIIGRVESGSLTDCEFAGDINSASYYSGNLVGLAVTGDFIRCHTSGAQDNKKSNYARAGGLIGQLEGGSVTKCYSSASLTGLGHFMGGLIGCINGDVNVYTSYATGSVSAPTSGNKAGIGGLIGRIEKGTVEVDDCYSTGAIKADRWSGGFIGNMNDGTTVTVKNGYTTSDISGITRVKGIFTGNTYTSTVTVTGFVAWKVTDDPFYGTGTTVLSTAGNYHGADGTVSFQATALGWSTDVWDLSGTEPKLK